MQRDDGSHSIDDADRPNLTRDMTIEAIFDYDDGNSHYTSSKIKGRNSKGKAIRSGRRLSHDELQTVRAEQPDTLFTHPDLAQFQKGDGGKPHYLYQLTALKADLIERPNDPVIIVEGEGCVDRVREAGGIATTNPNGAGKWKPEYSTICAGRHVILFPDNDQRGGDHMEMVAASVGRYASSVKIVELPGLDKHGDVADWLDAGNTLHDLLELAEKTPARDAGFGAGDTSEHHSRLAPDQFSTNDDGVPYKTQRNARVALHLMGASLSYDEFAGRYLVEGLDGFGPVLDDAALTRMRLRMEEEFRLLFGKDRWFDIATDHARKNSFHPVRDYLASLRHDGVARLDRWLHRYGGAADNEYTRAVGAIALIAAVRRVRGSAAIRGARSGGLSRKPLRSMPSSTSCMAWARLTDRMPRGSCRASRLRR